MKNVATPKNILVVDDDPAIREIILFILEEEGYSVSGLDNGQAVAAAVKQNRPDLVLLDVQLGDSDGRDICRELKDRPETQTIPIIMISANHGWQEFQEKECIPDDFLSKPFDIFELVDHVRRFAA